MLLLYYRIYTNHIFMGMLMDIDDNNACKYFRIIEPQLTKIFKTSQRKITFRTKGKERELMVGATE